MTFTCGFEGEVKSPWSLKVRQKVVERSKRERHVTIDPCLWNKKLISTVGYREREREIADCACMHISCGVIYFGFFACALMN